MSQETVIIGGRVFRVGATYRVLTKNLRPHARGYTVTIESFEQAPWEPERMVLYRTGSGLKRYEPASDFARWAGEEVADG